MQTQRTFIDDLRYQYKNGGITIRLIFINVVIFLAINILAVFGKLLGTGTEANILYALAEIFTLKTSFIDLVTHPWGLFTSIFAHFSLWHLLFNMVFLYFSGRMFEQLFNQKRLLYTYLLGGIAGGAFEILAHAVFPGLWEMAPNPVVGASGSIMAIFFSIAFYRPQMTVNLFGLLPVRIIILAGAFFLLDFLKLGDNDGTAHFAHIGGAVIGMIGVQNLSSSGNIITQVSKFGDRIAGLFKRRSKLKVQYSNSEVRREKDEDYNARKKQNQSEIDRILDKISKSGYDSLSKKEKDFLFNQSKNG
jgi:membrane associated rhomboid family serine protease